MKIKGDKYIFSREDTWSLDITLNPIISEGLKKFLEVIVSDDIAGHPSDTTWEQWLDMLDKMIYAFDSHEPEIPDGYLHMEIIEEPNEQGDFPIEITVTDQIKYDIYKEELIMHENKVQEGLNLFAKYYKHLWW